LVRTALLFAIALALLPGCDNWAAEPNALAGPARSSMTSTPGRQAPLRVGYSDWPGWTALEIGVERGWFRKTGLRVELVRSDYVASLDAFSSGKLEAVTVTNGDALAMGAAGAKSKMILLTDYSNGNDKIVARPGIDAFADLKGKTVGLEFTMAEHLLFLKACEKSGISANDVFLVNVPTSDTPEVLNARDVAAIGAWYPISGMALRLVPGAKTLFTSADVPGLIYGALAVRADSLTERQEDWIKFARVWYWIVDFIRDPKTHDLAASIMATKIGVTHEEYAASMAGTYFLSLLEARARYARTADLDSLYGSTSIADDFNVAHKVYKSSQPVDDYIEPKVVESL
jgi:NitT/TauT family transport system substrate-binding protein